MKRKRLIIIISVMAAATAAFSLYMIVSTLITGAQEQNAFDALTAVVEQQREQADSTDGKPEQITSPVVTEPIAKDDPGFQYYQYIDLTDPAVFAEYMEQVSAAAIYDTEITAEYGDELIALSTCSYHTDNGRFVVVAKKVCIQP